MSALSGIMGKIEGLGSAVALKGKAMIDSIFPPEKRNELLAKIQAFAMKNPKLSVKIPYPKQYHPRSVLTPV